MNTTVSLKALYAVCCSADSRGASFDDEKVFSIKIKFYSDTMKDKIDFQPPQISAETLTRPFHYC
jgi:hypothetical protein